MNSSFERAPVKPVEGQCGTCFFAKAFDYGGCPSGPEDGVHCVSLEHAKYMDEQCNPDNPEDAFYNQFQEEISEWGYMDLFRYEVLVEETYRCEHWVSTETQVLTQLMPAPDEAPLTSCPGCGKEYNVKEEERSDYAEVAPGVFRHVCGNLVKFEGGV